jgi:alkylhydroperoxidase family enzyme
MKSHAAVAAELLNDPALVVAVMNDMESSALTEAEMVLMRFVDKVNHDSPHITRADTEPLYAAGWNDEPIYYAITVCALFNFYNRWIDATGVHPLSDQAHRQGGKRSAQHGYVRK